MAYAKEHMLTLHTHFNPTLVQFESFWAILGVWRLSFALSIAPLELPIEIEMKKMISVHLALLSMWVLHNP
jgi:hypothetical protein